MANFEPFPVRGLVKPKVVVASGHFSLGVHAGHIEYLQAAAKLGILWVIVNNDEQVQQKLGQVYLPQEDRLFIVRSLSGVAKAILSADTDRTVCRTLRLLHDAIGGVDIFANGGDVEECREAPLCQSLGIECVYGVGGKSKRDSSSALLKKIIQQ